MTIVMLAGSPVSMKPWADRAKAIVWMSYSGMEGGTALAEVLFGAVNPSGKLAETLPEEIPECFRKEAYFPGRPLTDEEKKHMNAHLTQTYAEGISWDTVITKRTDSGTVLFSTWIVLYRLYS